VQQEVDHFVDQQHIVDADAALSAHFVCQSSQGQRAGEQAAVHAVGEVASDAAPPLFGQTNQTDAPRLACHKA
jgi:hypothetical protein